MQVVTAIPITREMLNKWKVNIPSSTCERTEVIGRTATPELGMVIYAEKWSL